MRICIDPGHGGCQPGAVYQGIREADLVLPMSMNLGALLHQAGHDVLLTRTDDRDVSLRERCRMSDAFGADLFLCMHLNAASSPDANGSEIWVWTGSRAFMPAREIQRGIVEATGARDRKVRETQKYYVLRHTKALAMVIEPGFMSCESELESLKNFDYQRKIIGGILNGLKSYRP